MKKMLLILPLLTLPLTAHASENPTQASNESIEATAKKFFPIFSTGRIQDSLEAVKKCYQQTPVTDPNIERCMI